jgi:hypothetical protein
MAMLVRRRWSDEINPSITLLSSPIGGEAAGIPAYVNDGR